MSELVTLTREEHQRLIFYGVKIKEERDELLAVLKKIMASGPLGSCMSTGLFDEMHEAIAKAEGE